MLHENAAMLGVFRNAGFDITRAGDGGEVEIRFPIAPTTAYREQVAARDHVAVRASLEPFFRPSSVAVIGASNRRGNIGGELFRNVLAADFAGAVYPVNRKGDSVAGVRGYAAVGEIPEAVDLAVICLPGDRCSRRRKKRSPPGCARSSSSPPALPRPAARVSNGRRSCSRSSASTAPASSARTASASPPPPFT